MKKKKQRKVKGVITMRTTYEFESYDTDAKNKRAEKYILGYIRDTIKHEVGFLGLYIEMEGNGISSSYREDQARIKVIGIRRT